MSRPILAAFALGAALLAPTLALADVSMSAAGSTALQPLVQAAAEAYQAQHSDVKISVTGGGSRTGLSLVASKAVDLGDSDILAVERAGSRRPQSRRHRLRDRDQPLGRRHVADQEATARHLLRKSHELERRRRQGRSDHRHQSPASSGTRAVFVKTIMGSVELSKDTLTEDATGTVVQKVKQTSGAISYAAFSGTHNQTGINELSIDGSAPTDENVEAGKYPFWSYEHIYTNGPPSKDVSRFIAFVQSNSALLHKTGYILVRDMKVTENDR